MYMCVYVSMYTYTYMAISIYAVYTCLYVNVYVCMYVYIYICLIGINLATVKPRGLHPPAEHLWQQMFGMHTCIRWDKSNDFDHFAK